MNKQVSKKRGKDYRQVVIPVLRGSSFETFYINEAKTKGIGLPTLFSLLLQDRQDVLSGMGNGLWFPPHMLQVEPARGKTQKKSENEIKASPALALNVFGSEDD